MVGMDVKRPNPFDMDDMWEVRMYAVKLQHENDFLRRALARSETVVYARMSWLIERLTRAHLAIGEALGLTHYRNCWDCSRCHGIGDERSIVLCDLYYDDDGVYAFTDPSEAVWCHSFKETKHD